MTRTTAPLQVNGFEGGFNTEYNPLEAPPNVSFDEVNMELRNDKSREKRLGFSYEEGGTTVSTGVNLNTSNILASRTFRWTNAGGDPRTVVVVAQVGNAILFFKSDGNSAISDNHLYTKVFSGSVYDQPFDFTVIDGSLVVTTGLKDVYIFEYDGTSISYTTSRLKVRDFYGLAVDSYTTSEDVATRPSSLSGLSVPSGRYIYNLRNQTFAYPRYNGSAESLEDPITAFRSQASRYPSHADNVNNNFYADPNDSGDRLTRRFFANAMDKESPGTSRAPQGFFVIDALDRGSSRFSKVTSLQNKNGPLDHTISGDYTTVLGRDESQRGATTTTTYAGRVWYAGFTNEVVGGDANSPGLASYLMFSLLVSDKNDITECYQKADPTSPDDSVLVATDGGVIRLDNAYGIKKLEAVGDSLLVFAENGVWRVFGSQGSGFRATSYEAEKISNSGCVSGASVVVFDKTALYWGSDSIYALAPNRFGVWESQDLTEDSIQSFYSAINFDQKFSCQGVYDEFERVVRWVYTASPEVATSSEELIFSLKFGCFTPNTIPFSGDSGPIVVCPFNTRPYGFPFTTNNVTVDGVEVTAGGEDVTITTESQSSSVRNTLYLVLSGYEDDLDISCSFGAYSQPTYYDWGDEEVSYDAYLITGSVTGGEARLKKQVPYLSTFFEVTESGLTEEEDLITPSSCLFSSRWNWTDNAVSGKWSTPRQSYRTPRTYSAESSSATFNQGETMISTRNKVRGIGHSIAFKFEGEPGHAMHIYGWAFNLQANDKE